MTKKKCGRGKDRRAQSEEAPWDPLAAINALVALDPADQARVLKELTVAKRRELEERWFGFEHDGQREPPGRWRVWLIRAGRGFGKTRAGAEWVSELARQLPDGRIALVGASIDDARRVMIEGPSGLIAVARSHETWSWRRGMREFRFHSGALATLYSAETPDALRGPEHHAAWCDELAKWRRGDEAWDNLMLGLRLGERPRTIVTTTPRPIALMRRIIALPDSVETVGRTRDNPHLPTSFVATMAATYGATRIGRQELDGELIDDIEGALWTRGMIEKCRIGSLDSKDITRVVVAVDPPASAGGDECGIVAAALLADGRIAVIEDASVGGLLPEGWANAVALCAARHGADRVVAEANQGGDMVRSVLCAANQTLPVRLVHASRGKVARAEPVSVLYANGGVVHAGGFAELEDQLCGMLFGGDYAGPGRSPDRADALVWAVSELVGGAKRRARVRAL